MNEGVPPTVLSPVPLTEVLVPAELGPGTFLHHFRVDRRIASGGMGAVYLGFDTSLNRPVALKTLRPELARDPEFLARFQREAQSQANLVHPHVIQIYFVGEERGVWFMAMQLVDGGSLQDAVDRHGRLPWTEVAAHLLGIAEALVEAARLGVVHRDLKPANVLLDRYGIAHVADFGLVTTTHAPSDHDTLVRSPLASIPGLSVAGSVMGTLPYMAPEQLKGQPLDQRADVYGLGATVYHLLVGQPPVKARTPAEALQQIEAGIVPVRRARTDVPRALASIVDRCLAPDPAARFQSHQELAREVRRAAPQPQVAPAPLVRLLAGVIDLLPALAVFYFLFEAAPWAPAAWFALWLALGIAFLGASPGQWLMRLRVRTDADGDVPPARAAMRALLQWGWFAALSLAYSLISHSAPVLAYGPLGVGGAAWAAVVLLGALPAALRKPTLVDRLTRTRVLVDVR
ncbi:MAG TPA: protein kinase [Myxococcaceae bacterium]|nr:protein kinase [Myxococcaceae bacterium]